MTPRTCRTTVIALAICIALPAWGQQYLLYAPQPATSAQKPTSQEGILVQEVEIQKGDTLYGLSRKFSGHGMYFPQILLFNSINNPNLIYPGKTLKIPVSKSSEEHAERASIPAPGAPRRSKTTGASPKAAGQSAVRPSAAALPVSTTNTELSLSDLKTVGTSKSSVSRLKNKKAKTPSHEPPLAAATEAQLPATNKSTAAGQKLFETAVKAYRQDDCRTALELLDRYLADNSGSPLAADANLYKAECYLKLSAQ